MFFVLLLQYCILLCLLPTGGKCFEKEPDKAYYYLGTIEFILLWNCIHLFVLELAIASSAAWSMQGGIYWI